MAMTTEKMREVIAEATTRELEDELAMYSGLQSKGVRDELIISLVEQELIKRGVEV